MTELGDCGHQTAKAAASLIHRLCLEETALSQQTDFFVGLLAQVEQISHLVYWKTVAVLSHDVAAKRSRLTANLTLEILSRGTDTW